MRQILETVSEGGIDSNGHVTSAQAYINGKQQTFDLRSHILAYRRKSQAQNSMDVAKPLGDKDKTIKKTNTTKMASSPKQQSVTIKQPKNRRRLTSVSGKVNQSTISASADHPEISIEERKRQEELAWEELRDSSKSENDQAACIPEAAKVDESPTTPEEGAPPAGIIIPQDLPQEEATVIDQTEPDTIEGTAPNYGFGDVSQEKRNQWRKKKSKPEDKAKLVALAITREDVSDTGFETEDEALERVIQLSGINIRSDDGSGTIDRDMRRLVLRAMKAPYSKAKGNMYKVSPDFATDKYFIALTSKGEKYLKKEVLNLEG